jgi:hypothetical protein
MRRKSGFTTSLFLITLLLLQSLGPTLLAQTAPPTTGELDQLLAPIALYPDSAPLTNYHRLNQSAGDSRC